MKTIADRPVVGLVPAAGRGVRLAEAVPKAFVELDPGTPMLRRAVDGLLESGVVDSVIVTVPAELVDRTAALLQGPVLVVAGGAERSDSVRAGLAAAPDNVGYFLVHDAARPLTPPELIRRIVAELQSGRAAVIPAIPVADTIKYVDVLGYVTETPDRSELRAIQTPQGFHAELLRKAYESPDLTTDDAGLVEAMGERIHTIPGDPLAFKITTPLDLMLARALVAEEARS